VYALFLTNQQLSEGIATGFIPFIAFPECNFFYRTKKTNRCQTENGA
jgi:hypothetical protein